MARYAVMFNNNKYFKDDCVLNNAKQYVYPHVYGTNPVTGKWEIVKVLNKAELEAEKTKKFNEMLEYASTMDLSKARLFSDLKSITSALGAGGLARSRGEFSILEVSIVPGAVVE